MFSVGSGAPTLALSTRGAMQLTSPASVGKLMCSSLSQRGDPINLFIVMFADKEVVFDRTTFLHGTDWASFNGALDDAITGLPGLCERFFEVPTLNYYQDNYA